MVIIELPYQCLVANNFQLKFVFSVYTSFIRMTMIGSDV